MRRLMLSCLVLLILFQITAGSTILSPRTETARAQADPVSAPAMNRGNPARTGEQPGPGPSGSPRPLWRFQTGDAISTTPIVVNGVVYLGANDRNLYALDASDGRELWRFAGTGGFGTPVVVDGLVISAAGGILYALSAADGEELWRADSPADDPGWTSPVVVENTVYVSGTSGLIAAFDAKTGTTTWTYQADSRNPTSVAVAGGSLYFCSDAGIVALNASTGGDPRLVAERTNCVFPVVADDAVYGAMYDTVFAIDIATGRERWRQTYQSTGMDLPAPAVVNGSVYVVDSDGELTAFDAATGDERWKTVISTTAIWGSPSVAGTTLYAGTYEGVSAIDTATGDLLWTFGSDTPVWAALGIVDGVVYFGSDDGVLTAIGDAAPITAGPTGPMERGNAARTGAQPGPGFRQNPAVRWTFPTGGPIVTTPVVVEDTVVTGSADGIVYAIDTTTGQERWRFPTGDAIFGSPAVVDGVVFISSLDGILYALDLESGEERWRAESPDPEWLGWTSPAVAGGTVYSSNMDGNVAAFDAATGEERWRFDTGSRQPGAIAVAGTDVLLCSDTRLLALDATSGLIHWSFDRQNTCNVPVLVDGTIFGADVAALFALDSASGEERWRYTFETGFLNPLPLTVAGGTVYTVEKGGRVLAFQSETGGPVWDSTISTTEIWSAPALAGDALFLGAYEGAFALDAATGAILWHLPTVVPLRGSPAVLDGIIYIGGDDGVLYAIQEGAPPTPTPSPTQTPTPTPTATPEPSPTPTQTPEPEPGLLRVVSDRDSSQGVLLAPGASIELILDTSGSMLQEIEPGRTRADIAKEVLADLVRNTIPAGAPVALRVFGTQPESCETTLAAPLAPLDPEALATQIEDFAIVDLVNTPLGASLEQVANDLRDATGPKIVVLVTDGEETCGGDPRGAIQSLVDQGIDVRVNIVGFALDDEELKREFRSWARISNGQFFDATNADELGEALVQALQPTFDVVDAGGTVVTSGIVNGSSVRVRPGTYTIVIHSDPEIVVENVEVVSDERSTVRLD